MSMKESSAYRNNTCVALLQDDSYVCFLLSLTSLCSPGDHTAALSLCSKNPLKQPPLFSLSADFFSCSKNLRSSGCLSLTVLSFSSQLKLFTSPSSHFCSATTRLLSQRKPNWFPPRSPCYLASQALILPLCHPPPRKYLTCSNQNAPPNLPKTVFWIFLLTPIDFPLHSTHYYDFFNSLSWGDTWATKNPPPGKIERHKKPQNGGLQ